MNQLSRSGAPILRQKRRRRYPGAMGKNLRDGSFGPDRPRHGLRSVTEIGVSSTPRVRIGRYRPSHRSIDPLQVLHDLHTIVCSLHLQV